MNEGRVDRAAIASRLVVAQGRGTYRMQRGQQALDLPLPDVVFPEQFLSQSPLSPDELAVAAEWFVYEMDTQTGRPVIGPRGKPRHNAMFAHLCAITLPSESFFFKLCMRIYGTSGMRVAMKRMGVATPYATDAVAEITRITHGSRVRAEYAGPGMQYFYTVIAPVYEFFHQFNTGAVPLFSDEEFSPLGPLPLGVAPTARFTSTAPLYPNDAIGRDGVAEDVVSFLAGSLPARAGAPRRALAIGDGPGMTTFKIAERATARGIRDLEIVILELNDGQIENGRRAWDRMRGSGGAPANVSIVWRHGTAAEAQLPANHFDAAFSTYVVGAMGDHEAVAAYGRATLVALKPGGKHIVLDFYDRHDDPDYAKEPTSAREKNARIAARLLARVTDPVVHQIYEGIWDHKVWLNNVLDEASLQAGASLERTHRQTIFAHAPLARLGKRTLAFSFAGYNERKAVYTKLGAPREQCAPNIVART